MVVKVFRSIWFLSVLSVMAALLYHYAYLPEEVVVGQEDINFVMISREAFFYTSLAIISLINVTVYIVKRLANRLDALQAWFYGWIGIINFFLIIGLSLVMLFNSNEAYDFARIRGIIYGSIFLVGAWFIGGILYLIVQKSTKTLSKSS
jgi:hypothetical protein